MSALTLLHFLLTFFDGLKSLFSLCCLLLAFLGLGHYWVGVFAQTQQRDASNVLNALLAHRQHAALWLRFLEARLPILLVLERQSGHERHIAIIDNISLRLPCFGLIERYSLLATLILHFHWICLVRLHGLFHIGGLHSR